MARPRKDPDQRLSGRRYPGEEGYVAPVVPADGMALDQIRALSLAESVDWPAVKDTVVQAFETRGRFSTRAASLIVRYETDDAGLVDRAKRAGMAARVERAAATGGEVGPSLGWDIVDWCEAFLKVPDGRFAGEALTLTAEQANIVVRFYELSEHGRPVVRRAAVRRPKGWGKSPLLAMIALAELCGPSQFGGWDPDGEPVGVRAVAPTVQLVACSEDQSENTYRAALGMVERSELNETVIDVGVTHMKLIGETGVLEMRSHSPRSIQGGRPAFCVVDESHEWVNQSAHKTFEAIVGNAAKMGGRSFESTNAFAVGEDSVAERTWKAAQDGTKGLLYDAVEPSCPADLTDRPAVLAALQVAYGDASAWIDLERIADEIADPSTDESYALRFYLNVLRSGASCPIDIPAWEELARPGPLPEAGAQVGLGFVGGLDDAAVLFGCTREGFIFEVQSWDRPVNDPEWRVPRAEVTATIADAFDRWPDSVLFADPAKWRSEIEAWEAKYGDKMVVRVRTNSAAIFSPLCDKFTTAVSEHAVTHDGRPELTQSLAATARKNVRVNADETDGRTPFVIVRADTRRIDRAVAAVLALDAAEKMPEPDDGCQLF